MATEVDPLKADFRLFLCLVWQFLRLPPPTRIQLDIAKYLQHGPRRRIIEAFRGVGKSWVTVAYVVWLLYCDPQLKILVVSGAQKNADNFTTFALQIINGLPELAHLIPKPDQREAKIQFDVGPALPSKDPSVSSVGITGQINGIRADVIVADDIETANNSLTQTMRDKISELVKEFDSVLKPGGIVTYLGTPQFEQSLYNTLQGRGYKVCIWPARFPDEVWLNANGENLAPYVRKLMEDKVTNKVGTPIDPQRFSHEDLLEREASLGRSSAQLQFMLDTSLSDENRYPLKLRDLIVMTLDRRLAPTKVAWANAPDLVWNDLPAVGFNGDSKLYRPLYVEKDQWTEFAGSVLAIDPAGRGKDEVGYSVIKFLHGMLFCAAWGGLTGGYDPENLEFLARLAKEHKCTDLYIESNFGDGMFDQLLKPVMARVYPLCASEKSLKLSRSFGQKELRIIDTLEPVMNQHKLILDKAVIDQDFSSTKKYNDTQAHQYQGLYQLTRITKDRGSLRHDDRLEALAMGVRYWTESMAQDVDLQLQAHKEREFQKEIDSYWDHCLSREPSNSNWLG